jgi:hypothetical protein
MAAYSIYLQPPSIRNPSTHHAVLTGTHLTWHHGVVLHYVSKGTAFVRSGDLRQIFAQWQHKQDCTLKVWFIGWCYSGVSYTNKLGLRCQLVIRVYHRANCKSREIIGTCHELKDSGSHRAESIHEIFRMTWYMIDNLISLISNILQQSHGDKRTRVYETEGRIHVLAHALRPLP